MEGIFQTHGIPESVRSDNGPPFSSAEFEGFLDYLGIVHLKGIPTGRRVMVKSSAVTRLTEDNKNCLFRR